MDYLVSDDGGEGDEQQQQPTNHLSNSSASSGGGGEENRPLVPIPKAEAQAEAATTAPSTPNTYQNFIGRHRMQAAVSHLHQQIQIIQEELNELETLGESSLVCKELVTTVESVPDALLPVTKGPAVVDWDKWFQGAHVSRSRKRWI